MVLNLVIWTLACATYLLFAAAVSIHELVTAVVIASLAAVWARLIRGCSRRRFLVIRQMVMPTLRAMAGFFRTTAQTGKLIFKVGVTGGSPGRLHVTDFHFGSRHDPAQRTRRAAAVLLASVAPDRFVVQVDPKKHAVLIHDLIRRDHEPDPRWLE